jgi:hypothetical protein
MAEQQSCGTCKWWGSRNYGGTRFCKVAREYTKRDVSWPSSVRIESRMMSAEEGANCPCFEQKAKEGE